MNTKVNEGNVRAPFPTDSPQMRHSDGTWAKGGIGDAFQAQTRGPGRATAACWRLRASGGLKNE